MCNDNTRLAVSEPEGGGREGVPPWGVGEGGVEGADGGGGREEDPRKDFT